MKSMVRAGVAFVAGIALAGAGAAAVDAPNNGAGDPTSGARTDTGRIVQESIGGAFTFSVPGASPTGCGINSNPEDFFFNVTYAGAPDDVTVTATVVTGAGLPSVAGLSGTDDVTLPAGSNTNFTIGPFSLAAAGTLPVATPWAFTLRVLAESGGHLQWLGVIISCPAAAGPYTALQIADPGVSTIPTLGPVALVVMILALAWFGLRKQ
jgi:hypothetical protein